MQLECHPSVNTTCAQTQICVCVFYVSSHHPQLLQIQPPLIAPFVCSAAEFLSSVQRHSEACEQRVHAAELAPNEYALVVSAATALRLADRKSEAERWYRLVNIYVYILSMGRVSYGFSWEYSDV